MARLALKSVNKIYPAAQGANASQSTATGAHIINNANLTIEEGEFVVFVGPSGCGKSTMLRMIAGLETITSGELHFDDKVVNQLSPSERGIGMVFQSYALYPHMTVRENIAFGVRYTRDWSKAATQKAVAEIAEALELTALLDHNPSQMSGGQRQRVAIGRALIRQPSVFLLDEPLSNLDAALRVRMRMQIAKFHQQFKSTTVYVTHDQVEAMTLADKVVVLNQGQIEQVGSPLTLYHFPNSVFVATFIGSPKMNILPVQLLEAHDELCLVQFQQHRLTVRVKGGELSAQDAQNQTELLLGIRPEDIQIGSSQDIAVTVEEKELLGAESVLYTHINATEQQLLVRCPGTLQTDSDKPLFVRFPDTACHLFKPDGGAIHRSVTPETLFQPANHAVDN